MLYLSICVIFNFFHQCLRVFSVCLSPPCLNLFQGVSFLCSCKCDCFLNFFFLYFVMSYRNTADFCILILYDETLLNSFVSSKRWFVFLVDSIVCFFLYSIMSSANTDIFLSSFPVRIPVISFFP